MLRAVLVDISGVLEITPSTGWFGRWAVDLGLDAADLERFLGDLWDQYLGVGKPDPAIYLEACRRLAVRPEEAVFVDDVEVSVEGARAVGMRAVHHRDNAGTIAELDALLGQALAFSAWASPSWRARSRR